MLPMAGDPGKLINGNAVQGDNFCGMRLTLLRGWLEAGLQGFYGASLSP
jgi:hypothetical protein